MGGAIFARLGGRVKPCRSAALNRPRYGSRSLPFNLDPPPNVAGGTSASQINTASPAAKRFLLANQIHRDYRSRSAPQRSFEECQCGCPQRNAHHPLLFLGRPISDSTFPHKSANYEVAYCLPQVFRKAIFVLSDIKTADRKLHDQTPPPAVGFRAGTSRPLKSPDSLAAAKQKLGLLAAWQSHVKPPPGRFPPMVHLPCGNPTNPASQRGPAE